MEKQCSLLLKNLHLNKITSMPTCQYICPWLNLSYLIFIMIWLLGNNLLWIMCTLARPLNKCRVFPITIPVSVPVSNTALSAGSGVGKCTSVCTHCIFCSLVIRDVMLLLSSCLPYTCTQIYCTSRQYPQTASETCKTSSTSIT